MRVGFHASHEQAFPSALLQAVRDAEQAGFDAAMCSDHLFPWSTRHRGVGFAWSWLGAALEATSLSFGTVTAPGQRYHPAIVAQAAATLAEMYPGRFWLALGSGENQNEHVTGTGWPRKELRDRRLEECVDVIRALWRGETVTHDGLVTVDRARVYCLPERPPLLAGAAVTPATAGRVGRWADACITVNQAPERLREVASAFREGGGGGKPLLLQVHVSYDPDEERALAVAHDQWRAGALGPPLAWDLALPEEFDAATRFVRPDDMREHVLVSSDPGWFAERIAGLAALGFDEVYLHHVGVEQRPFVDVFGEHVLPALR